MSLLVMIMGIGSAFVAARAAVEGSELRVADDHPGSRVDVAVIAHDDPDRILETIDRFDEWEAEMRPRRCVVMAPMTSGELLVTAIAAGADGWVLPDIPPVALVRTIEGIHAGESGFSRAATVHLVAALRDRAGAAPADSGTTAAAADPPDELDLLTVRERQIHVAYRSGRTPAEIADLLEVSRSTVRWHLSRINKKLATDAEQAAPLRAPGTTAPIDLARTRSAAPLDVPIEPLRSSLADLGRAELRVALLVAEGMSNREVAEQLFISRHTVESHLRAIYSKTHLRSRVELTRLVLRGAQEPISAQDDAPDSLLA